MNLLYIVPEEHAVMGLMVSHPSTSKLYRGLVCFLSHSNYVIVLQKLNNMRLEVEWVWISVCVYQFGMTNEDLVGTKRRIRATVLAMEAQLQLQDRYASDWSRQHGPLPKNTSSLAACLTGWLDDQLPAWELIEWATPCATI